MYVVNLTDTQKLVRQFLLESHFKDETLLSIYELFKARYKNLSITFEDFKDAYGMFETFLMTCRDEYDSVDELVSSIEEINPIYLTIACLTLEELCSQQTGDTIDAILDDTVMSYYYDGVDLGALIEAYYSREEYSIYCVDISLDTRTKVYSITAEELAKQVENARKEIELCGKVAISCE